MDIKRVEVNVGIVGWIGSEAGFLGEEGRGQRRLQAVVAPKIKGKGRGHLRNGVGKLFLHELDSYGMFKCAFKRLTFKKFI